MFKEFVLYIVLAWQVTPITPEEQKTVIIEFDSFRECNSVAKQVDKQVKAARAVFYLKTIGCLPCRELYGAKSPHCPAPAVAKKTTP